MRVYKMACLIKRDATYVLSADHLGSHFSESFTHDADLLGGNVVDIDEQGLAVLLDGLLEIIPMVGLSLLGSNLLTHLYS